MTAGVPAAPGEVVSDAGLDDKVELPPRTPFGIAELDRALASLIEGLRTVSTLLWAWLPAKMDTLLGTLGVEDRALREFGEGPRVQQVGDLEFASLRLAVVAVRHRLDAALFLGVVPDDDADRHVRGDHLPRRGRGLERALEPLDLSRPQKGGAVAGLGRRLLEVPVGFKHFVPGLLDGTVGFGGEESAGASFLRHDGTVWTTDKDGIAAALLGLAGGVLLVARPGEDSPRQNKYEKETVRREKVREDLEEDPQSGRVLWDAISADIDPTDPDFRSSKGTR